MIPQLAKVYGNFRNSPSLREGFRKNYFEFRRYTNLKLNNFERHWGRQILVSNPTAIYLEVTNRCNARCFMCGRNFGDFPYGDMEWNIFLKCIPILKTIVVVNISGWGEPFVNRNFTDYLDLVRRYSVPQVGFQTNGMFLDDATAKRIVLSGIYNMTISIDSLHPETFAEIRRGVQLEKVAKGIANINKWKSALHRDTPKLGLEFVAMRKNISELPAIIEWAYAMNFEKVMAVFLIVHHPSVRDESLFYDQELADEVFARARETALALQRGSDHWFDLMLPHSFSPAGGTSSQLPEIEHTCLEPWTTLYIRWDGTVLPCCFCNEIMGDLKNESLRSIWNNEKYRQLRRTVNTPDKPDFCRLCHGAKMQNVNDESTHIKC